MTFEICLRRNANFNDSCKKCDCSVLIERKIAFKMSSNISLGDYDKTKSQLIRFKFSTPAAA